MKVIIIGGGRVGTTIGYLLHKVGDEIVGVCNRHYQSARKAVDQIGAGQPLTWKELTGKLPEVDLIIITTPDRLIEEIAQKINRTEIDHPYYLMHMSGLLSSDILKTGNQKHITGVFSFHPLQAVASFSEGEKHLTEAAFTIEGDRPGREFAKELAVKLGVNYHFIDKEYKPLYHAAAVISSNYLVTLIKGSFDLLKRAGLADDDLKQGIMRLVAGTLDNITEMGPERALTGPIARGDQNIISAHQEAITEYIPEYLELYNTLGGYTAGLAKDPELETLFSIRRDISETDDNK